MILNRSRSLIIQIMKDSKSKTPDPTQKSISNFFQKSTKRSSSSSSNNNETPPSKISKPSTTTNNTTPLSPEQRRRMEENKMKAKEKLLEKTMSSFDMGATWKKALESEFSKEYFIKVNNVLKYLYDVYFDNTQGMYFRSVNYSSAPLNKCKIFF